MPTFVHVISGLRQTRYGSLLLPGVRFLEDRTRPRLRDLQRGSCLEIRLPDGGRISTSVTRISVAPRVAPVPTRDLSDPLVQLTIPRVEEVVAGSELWFIDGSEHDVTPRELTDLEQLTHAFTRYSALSSSATLTNEQLVGLINDAISLHEAGRITNEQRFRRVKNLAIKQLGSHPAVDRIVQYLAHRSVPRGGA